MATVSAPTTAALSPSAVAAAVLTLESEILEESPVVPDSKKNCLFTASKPTLMPYFWSEAGPVTVVVMLPGFIPLFCYRLFYCPYLKN